MDAFDDLAFAGAGVAAAPEPFARPRTVRRRSAERHLTALLEQNAFVLHGVHLDPAVPPVDHIAVAESGVWVVASLRVPLERIQVRRGLRTPAALRVGAADRTGLVRRLDRQRLLVCGLLGDLPHVPVHTAVAIAGGRFPLLGSLTLDDCAILPPAELAARIGAGGILRRSDARDVTARLEARLGL